MKKITILLSVLVLLLSPFLGIGQNASTSKIQKIAVVKTTSTNGDVTVRKVPWSANTNLDDFKAYFGLGLPFIKEVDVQIVVKGSAVDKEISERNVYNLSDSERIEAPIKIPSYRVAKTSSNNEKPVLQKRKRRISRFLPVFLEDAAGGKGALIVAKTNRYSALTKQLKKGDIIVSMDGHTISNSKDVQIVSVQYILNPVVSLEVLRKGKRIKIKNQSLVEANSKTDRTLYDYKSPCKIFIGISNGAMGGQGNRVFKVIENTAAEKMGLQKDDLIIELNGKEVLNRHDLLVERNKNESGDFFTLKVFRNGKKMKLKGQFAPCEKTAEVKIPDAAPSIPNTFSNKEFDQTEQLQVFPNPTNGAFSIKVDLPDNSPVEILVTNILGEMVSYKKLEVSDSNLLQRDFDLKNQVAGIYLISITQKDRIFTQKIILK